MAIDPAFDLSRVPNLEIRKMVEAYYYGSDDTPPGLPDEREATAAIRAKIDEAEDTIRAKAREFRGQLVGPLEKELEAIEAPYRAYEEKRGEELEEKLKGSGLELTDFQLHNDYCGVHCCYLSGLPLMADDEVGTTPSGDEFLFCLLPEATP